MRALIEVLTRIAEALEKSDHMTPEQTDRMLDQQSEQIAIHRRQLDAAELHNKLHEQGVPHGPDKNLLA